MKNKIINLVKKNKCWILLLICLVLFIFILVNVLNNNIVKFDNNIYKTINMLKTDFTTKIFKIITEFGGATVLICIALISIIVIKNKRIGTAILLNLVSVGWLNYILKVMVKRPRPEEFRIVEETGYSFPSGHSMASMAFYGLIIYFVLKYMENKKAKISMVTILSILILAIGISRIYLGVHYASDVLAGFIFSITYLIIYITVVLKIMKI